MKTFAHSHPRAPEYRQYYYKFAFAPLIALWKTRFLKAGQNSSKGIERHAPAKPFAVRRIPFWALAPLWTRHCIQLRIRDRKVV